MNESTSNRAGKTKLKLSALQVSTIEPRESKERGEQSAFSNQPEVLSESASKLSRKGLAES
jgi:hypothetical protein